MHAPPQVTFTRKGACFLKCMARKCCVSTRKYKVPWRHTVHKVLREPQEIECAVSAQYKVLWRHTIQGALLLLHLLLQQLLLLLTRCCCSWCRCLCTIPRSAVLQLLLRLLELLDRLGLLGPMLMLCDQRYMGWDLYWKCVCCVCGYVHWKSLSIK